MLGGIALVASAAACTGGPTREEANMTAAQSITVTSTAFAGGQAIPVEHTCDGAGVAPPLSWTGVPPSAAALAIVVDDPDAPRGTFTHWVVLDLPTSTTQLDGETLPAGATEARNSGGRVGYYPPCPPSGIHRYRFTVHALERATGLPPGTDLATALEAVRAATMAEGTLTGVYSRKR
jgi:Raf kinase inhibitor-like YbhB/YbcL family protein